LSQLHPAPPRTLWSVARRPRWIAALLLALAVASAFAALGQWQLARSVESAVAPNQKTESVVALESVAQPQQPVLSIATGQLVSVTATFVAGDYVVLSDRVNLAAPGYWVVGHAVTARGDGLAVAMGWAASADAAASAIRSLKASPPPADLVGRYLPSESPQQSDFEHGKRSALAVSELVNVWSNPPDAVYGGYLVLHTPIAGLDLIDSPAPTTEVSFNLLNIFYAIEWALFAGFAVFLWYRLVKDAWEAEVAASEAIAPDTQT
jgi:cytochrome oxidase assembly protein ShyY1